MKQTILVIFILTLVAALLLLLLWGGDGGLQAIYLWIAEQENAARGIDGITEASRLKVMDDAVRHFAIYRKVWKGAPVFFRVRSTQTLHDSINKGFICMCGRIVVPLRHLIIEV